MADVLFLLLAGRKFVVALQVKNLGEGISAEGLADGGLGEKKIAILDEEIADGGFHIVLGNEKKVQDAGISLHAELDEFFDFVKNKFGFAVAGAHIDFDCL